MNATRTDLRRACRRTIERARLVAARHPTLVAGSGYLLIVVALFQDLVFRGRVLFERDIHLFWYAQVESFVRIVTTPAWPLWDPYASFGQPLLADASAQILYPPTWLNLLMRPWVYYSLFIVTHTWLAGIGLWRLARALGLSALAAFTAGALWMASGPLLSTVNLYHHLAGACWMPWVLLAAEATVKTLRPRYAALWALAAGIQVLAGSADMCALTVFMTAALLARHLIGPDRRGLLAVLRQGAVAVGLTIALTAALWWPALEAVLHSARHALPEFQRTYWSVHPWSLIELLYPPGQRTLPLSGSLRSLLYEGREPFLASIYLGLPALALLLAAPLTRQRRLFWTLLSTFAFALAFALGRHAPFHAALTTVLPFLRVFRYPQKAMVLVALCGALLAGLGCDAWRTWNGRRRLWTLHVLIGLSVCVVAGWSAVAMFRGDAARAITMLADPELPREALAQGFSVAGARLAVTMSLATLVLAMAFLRLRAPARLPCATIVAVLAMGDVAFQHRDLHATTVKEFYLHRPPVLDYLPTGDHSRLYVYDYLYAPGRARLHLGRRDPYVPARGIKGWSFEEIHGLAYRDALAPPIAGTWARESSFEADYRGLCPRHVAELGQALLDAEGTPTHLRLLRIGAVRHVVTLHTRALESLEPVASVPGLITDPIHVLRVPNPLPRCYVVSGTRVADGSSALPALTDPTFDPTTTLLLPAGQSGPASPQFSGECRISEWRPDRVRLAVRASEAAHAVLVDAYDPGWQAALDGTPVDVQRANVAFRAIAIPAGEHDLTLFYRPQSVVWGSAISLVGALIAVGLLYRSRALGAAGERRQLS